MNIFLDHNKRIKIGDLGLSKISRRKELHASNVGTPLFLSPEQVRRQPYSQKIDIWAIGCSVYTLACLESPFVGDNIIALGLNIIHSDPRPIPVRYSPKLVDFISSMLKKDAKERPGINELISQIPIFVKKSYKKPKVTSDNLTPREIINKDFDNSTICLSTDISFFPKIQTPLVDFTCLREGFLSRNPRAGHRASSVLHKSPISHTPTIMATPEPLRLISPISCNTKKIGTNHLKPRTTIKDLAKIA